METIKSEFGKAFDFQLKELVTEFADVTQETQGLPPHRGIFDHIIKLTGYPKRQRRNRLSVHEFEDL